MTVKDFAVRYIGAVAAGHEDWVRQLDARAPMLAARLALLGPELGGPELQPTGRVRVLSQQSLRRIMSGGQTA
ncbi:MAG TPA: hypothetical protein VLF40_05170 [Candidatus Saccharimonadales bacterium]|nr:hypothetical protein [Candidatus Saccharimonadales bacterium]